MTPTRQGPRFPASFTLDCAGFLFRPLREFETRNPSLNQAEVVLTRDFKSYSQCGEDRIVAFLLRGLGIDKPSYLDIGAAHPVDHNNTYLLYMMSGRGVLVEATNTYNDLYRESRPDDIILNLACVPSALDVDSIDFYMSDNPGWHSVSLAHAELAEKLGKGAVKAPVKVPAMTIEAILRRHFTSGCPDVLSLDVEGVDHDILADLNFDEWRPKVVIAENAGGRPIHDALMAQRNYRPFGYTFVNSIYADANALKAANF
jgi:FkbM family methyltransferase